MVRRFLASSGVCMMILMPFFVVVAQETPAPAEAPSAHTEETPHTESDEKPTTEPPHDTSAADTLPPTSTDTPQAPSDNILPPHDEQPFTADVPPTVPPSAPVVHSSDPTNTPTPSPEHTPAPTDVPSTPTDSAPLPLYTRDDTLPQHTDTPAPDNTATTDKRADGLPLPSPLAHTVLITEVMLGTSTNTKEEYVELFNSGDTPVSLTGVSLKKTTQSGTESNLAAAKSLDAYTIAPHAFFVIANAAFTDTLHADAPFSGKSFTIAENTTVTLYDAAGHIIDRVGFGEAKIFDQKAAPNPPHNESIERKKNGDAYVDTDHNADDFVNNPCPQPGNFVPDNADAHITISEIYPKPCAASDPACVHATEFIELYNPHPFPVHLAQWRVRDASATGVHLFSRDDVIPAQSFRAFLKNTYGFALNDTGTETVTLINPLCTPVARATYTKARPHLSYNTADGDTWYWAQPTPSAPNQPNPAFAAYPQLSITEILPHPVTDERANEYIELYNPNDVPVDLAGWTLRDASASGGYTFATETIIPPHTFFAVYRSTFAFALNNTKDTISLITPGDTVMSTVSYTTARKGISYNLDPATHTWRWSRHTTPAAANVFNNLPVVRKKTFPQKGYKNVFTAFSLTATDPDGEKLTVRWDFGDGRRSYLWKTRHKYLANGTYNGSVRITDGSEDVTVPFTITITSFPHYNVAITEIFPNPDGRDTGAEYLTLTNHGKKTLDLFGWSIATGTTKKKLVNHPIREHVTLPKNGTLRITRTHAAITLPNTTGVIALRTPDGTTIDTVAYTPPGKSIPIDASYAYVNNAWQWRIVPDAKKRARAYAIATAAAARENERIAQRSLRDAAYTMIHTASRIPTSRLTTYPQWTDRLTAMIATINHALARIHDIPVRLRVAHVAPSTFPLYTATHNPSTCNPRAYITPSHTPFPLCTATNHTHF